MLIRRKDFGDINNLSYGCFECSKSPLVDEKEISCFIKSIGFEIIENDRKLIYPKELDILIPSKKIAIEFCGLYWHSEKNGKDKKYHLNKLNKCNEEGYRLITIFEDEWINSKELIKNKISHILGVSNKKRIYARECGITEVSSGIISKFCNKNHIQGYIGSSIKLGLYCKGELVAIMSFSKPSLSKGNKGTFKGVWELNRYCTSCNVIGGAGKLFKFFQRNYIWKEVFSFADKRWSNGNLYKELGFENFTHTEPNYFYFHKREGCKRIHRFNFRKQKLKEKLEVFDPSKTEYENMLINGWNRIWDCGNFKFTLKNKNYNGKL